MIKRVCGHPIHLPPTKISIIHIFFKKKGARLHIQRKRQYEAQRKKALSAVETLNQQILFIDDANATREIVETMSMNATAIKRLNKGMYVFIIIPPLCSQVDRTLDHVETTMDTMRDQMDQLREVEGVLVTPVSTDEGDTDAEAGMVVIYDVPLHICYRVG